MVWAKLRKKADVGLVGGTSIDYPNWVKHKERIYVMVPLESSHGGPSLGHLGIGEFMVLVYSRRKSIRQLGEVKKNISEGRLGGSLK